VATYETAVAGDPRLHDFLSLTDVALRRALEPAEGLFVAEGETVIRRAVARGFALRSVLLTSRWLPTLRDLLDPLDVPVLVADDALMADVTGFAVHRGALASVRRRPDRAVAEVLATADRVVVLEGMVDPTNVGAVLRSAAALGIDGVLLDPRCADPLYRRAVRVSMGSALALPHARVSPWPGGLEEVRAAGLALVALTPDPMADDLAQLPADTARRCALMLGTEGPGLSRGALAVADRRVRIPMRAGVDSLNVGAAAAVAFWAVTHGADR
jgi:tRNA G18 (ribose-2'-O)-methylase SpoU